MNRGYAGFTSRAQEVGMAYTLEEFQAQPMLWDHDHGLSVIRFTWSDITEGDEETSEYSDVIFMCTSGCVVVGHYCMPDSWLTGPRSPQGYGIYTIPWDAIKAIMSEKDFQVAVNCESADDQLLNYAI